MTHRGRPIAVDLFAGAGGMTLGFEQAGFDVLVSVDLDPIHCATHQFNFPFWKTICADARRLTGQELLRVAGLEPGDVDVVFGGPPCQGFSLIGKRALDDPRNDLIHHFMRLVLELGPKYFVMENVPGITVGAAKPLLDNLVDSFEKNGYTVERPYRLLNAANYGVPQDRKRLFLLGWREGLTPLRYPAPTSTLPDSIVVSETCMFRETLPPCPTVWEAIGDLPEVERYDCLLDSDCARAEFGEPSAYARKLRFPSTDPEDYSYPRIYDPDILTSSRRTEHTAQSIQRFSETKQGSTEPVSRFYKLHPHGVCNTLRSGTTSDRGAFTSPRPIHPFTPRCITVREAARLHSFPDWFRFHTTKWHGFRQVGNSVPPLLARAVAAEVMKALGVRPVKPGTAKKPGDQRLLSMDMSEAANYFGVDRRIIPPRLRAADRSQPREQSVGARRESL